MYDSTVTLQGWVGTEVNYRETSVGRVASFRVGCTPRYRREGIWVDGETTWYTVNAWRTLALHVLESVKRGDAVVVHGRLRADTWRKDDGSESMTLVVDAHSIGHDLNRGVSVFTRAQPPRVAADDTEVKEINHSFGDQPQITSEGALATEEQRLAG